MTQVHRAPIAYGDLADHVGADLGASAWWTVTQAQIDAFAELTGDDQWIHTDPDRAARTALGGTVAHGLLVLSLAPSMIFETLPLTGVETVINRGCNLVRFTAPVPAGSRLRAQVSIASTRRRGPDFTEVVLDVGFEREDGTTACTAEFIALLSPKAMA
ncbi:MAG: MaoC family dehydratase [Solirubrobacteraceae bacterium]|nr:MaoC family dehydratase [Patulibacter sp.]